jgi:uncharacterized membrane-anchored protein YitT (DUF2179 family)
MEEKQTNNIYLFLIGVGLNLVALALFLLPNALEQQLVGMGLKWGNWWYYLVDAGPLVLVIVGIYIIQRSRGLW